MNESIAKLIVEVMMSIYYDVPMTDTIAYAECHPDVLQVYINDVLKKS